MNRLVYLLFAVCVSLSLMAQNDLTSSLNVDSIDLEDVVIRGTRLVEETPLTFQDIDQQQIEAINVGQDPVILIQELSPSVITYTDGGTDIGNYSQLRMRGIDQDRINITLNGVPLNDMADHGVYFSNFSDFGNSIESIQIQRGVGAGQTGVAAAGGAINFESINVFREGSSGNAQLTLGSFGTLRTAAELSSGLSEKGFGAYGRMTRTQTDGYKYNSGSDSYSFFFSGGYLGDKDMLKVTAFSGKTQNGQSYESVPLSVIEEDPRTNYNALNDIDDFEQHMVQLQYARQASDDLSFDITTYYSGAGGVFPYTWDGVQYMYGLTNDQYGVRGTVSHQSGYGRLDLGVHGYIFDRYNYEYTSPFINDRYNEDNTDKNEVSLFGKYQYTKGQWVAFANAELRSISMDIANETERMSDNSWTFLNASLGLSYLLSEGSTLYVSAGRANREPTRSNILDGVTEVEDVLDIELGWRYAQGDFALDANVFSMTFNNEIIKTGALQDLSYIDIRQNVDQSTRAGLEIASKYTANDMFTLGLNAAYLTSNIDEVTVDGLTFSDVTHIYSPNWIIQPSVMYHFADQSFFRLGVRYVSDSFSELSNNETFGLPSHFILNTQLSWRVAEAVRVDFMVNNITDQLYFTEGAPMDVDWDGVADEPGYRVQPPRNFYVMLTYDF